MANIWIYWEVNDYDADEVSTTIDGTPYSGTPNYLKSTYPDVFSKADSMDGLTKGCTAQVPDTTTLPVIADVNSVPEESGECEYVGGQWRPPNK